ncbi:MULTISPECIES: discoidin domain-containing protein [Vibrio]|uniref:discoidin domain-containing protein n=1 Tax=Vibrio TaxID=662 RepID=UPI001ABFC227|nr:MULTISPECIES: discoidin domain-containing protein [Vibrio]
MNTRLGNKSKLTLAMLALGMSSLAISSEGNVNYGVVSSQEGASASSYAWLYTDSFKPYPEMAEFAFDNIHHEHSQDHDLNTYWRPEHQVNEWLMQSLDKPEVVTRYSIQGENSDMHPEHWILQGSVDGETWKTLDERVNMEFDSRETKTFDVNKENQGSYLFYRFFFPSNVKPIAITEAKLMVQTNDGGDIPKPDDSRMVISDSDDYLTIKLTPDEYHLWNSTSINVSDHAKELTKEIMAKFSDDFDFIIYIMNNKTRPQIMPFGEFAFVKNDTQGVGLHQFDNSQAFGTAGKLQGVFGLYGSMNEAGVMKALHLDASLHELFHRWGNWIVDQTSYGHWDYVNGVLRNASVFAPIELYLMGLIGNPYSDDSDLWDLDSKIVYDTWSEDPQFAVRNPALGQAQTSFKGLVVLLTEEGKPLSRSMEHRFAANVYNFMRSDGNHKTYNNGEVVSRNFWNATGGRATIELDGLNASQIKP